jgi:hypothetical protein
VGDLTPYVGTYRSNQLPVDVSAVDGQLEEKVTYELLDDTQERIFTRFAGGSFPALPRRFVPVRKDLFAPAGMPLWGIQRIYAPASRLIPRCQRRPSELSMCQRSHDSKVA